MIQNSASISDETSAAALPPMLPKVGRGALWLTAARIIIAGLGLIRIVVLARMLMPSDFGLMAIAILALTMLERLSQTGFEKALIQKTGDIGDYLDTAWVISVLRGVLLCAVLFFSAPYIAHYFKCPAAAAMLKVMSASFVLVGLVNPGTVYFQKELVFSRQFVYQVGEVVVLVAVSVPLAFVFRNVWALIFGTLAGSLARLIISYAIHPYRPRLRISMSRARELFGYGKWICGSSILVFLITYGDNALVGKLLGPAALGLYVMAYRLSNVAASEIAHVVSQVSVPGYSKIQNDPDRVRGAYLRVLQAVAFVCLPVAGATFVLGPAFVRIFLDEKWLPMIGPLRLLCIAGVLRAVQNTYGSVFIGTGRPELITKIAVVNIAVMALLIFPLTKRFALEGTAAAVSVSLFISACYGGWHLVKVLNISAASFSRVILYPCAGVITFVSVIALVQIMPLYRVNLFSFSTLAAGSVFIYLGSLMLMEKGGGYDLKGLSIMMFRGLKGEK
jgi:lipopolysaccharide exporter